MKTKNGILLSTILEGPKENANEYWDEMENDAMEFIKKIAAYSIKDIDTSKFEYDWDFAKEVLEKTTNYLIKECQGVFPVVYGEF